MEEEEAAVLAVRHLRMERREVLKRRESLQIDSRRILAKHHLKTIDFWREAAHGYRVAPQLFLFYFKK